MLPYFAQDGYNPSSMHAEGRRARAASIRRASASPRFCGATPREIVFTGGGTEADNIAILGAARAARARGKHVVTSAIEHHAVLHAVRCTARRRLEVTLLRSVADGVVDPARFG